MCEDEENKEDPNTNKIKIIFLFGSKNYTEKL